MSYIVADVKILDIVRHDELLFRFLQPDLDKPLDADEMCIRDRDSLLHLAGVLDEIVHRFEGIVILFALLIDFHRFLKVAHHVRGGLGGMDDVDVYKRQGRNGR